MHSMTTFAVLEGESRDDSSDQQQQAAMFVSDILEKPSLSPRSAHQSPLRITSSDDARGCEEVDRIRALATHILATRGTSRLKYYRLRIFEQKRDIM